VNQPQRRKIFICTTDHSGDFHGALLAAALKKEDPQVELCGVGGEKMAGQGVRLLFNPVPHAVVGFFEIVRSLPTWRKFLNRAAEGVLREKPEKVILIDSPSFNLRLLRRFKDKKSPRFVYYISPQVWAWGSGRVKEIAAFCERVLVIFPFEEEIYRKAGVPVSFVGHPFLDTVRPLLNPPDSFRFFGLSPDKPVLLLLPGSRLSEVRAVFPAMAQVARRLAQEGPLQAVVYPASPEISRELSGLKGIKIITGGDKYSLFSIAALALAASGSVTLELTLLSVPYALLYRLSYLTYSVLRPMVRVPYAGITNLLAGKRVAPEFIQAHCRPDYILPVVRELLRDEQSRNIMKEEFLKIRNMLGRPGAAGRAAHEILYLSPSGRG
jgi:lipid-A-disaccharide synthase